jgi:glucosylceramidase
MIKNLSTKGLMIIVLLAIISFGYGQDHGIETWLTNADGSALFAKQPAIKSLKKPTSKFPTITVNENEKFQTMDGFGFTLTGGSAQHIMRMTPAARTLLLTSLFSTTGDNIGTSYLRLSIGASDLNEKVFSYNDLAEGETDMMMERFDLGADKADVIPVLKEVLKINPDIKIMGSPWSPPVWMKTNNDTRGGSLRPEYYDAYARYFVKYIQHMQKEGIRIDAITVQNEPLHPGNNPSLLMQAADQAIFIKNHLGPAFKNAGVDTKIIIYDHNADRPDYPLLILNDSDAKKYIDGSAFHLYGGKIEALSEVHNAHPDKNLYFTEQWIGAPGNLAENLKFHIKELVIGASRNWCKTVLEWNLANGPDNKPHTDRGGCDRCLGGVTIAGDSVTKNPAYYIVAHAAKFVRPGSIRIGSNNLDELPNVAFKTSSGRTVLIVYNHSETEQNFQISAKSKNIITALKPGAVATYVW